MESRAADYQRFAEERSLPMFRSHRGFLGVCFAGSGDERLVVTLWDSAASAAELQDSPRYLDTVAAIQASGFLLPPQTTEVFESSAGFELSE